MLRSNGFNLPSSRAVRRPPAPFDAFNYAKSLNLFPSFFAPFSDAGAGAVNLALSAGSGAATYARATSATCWSSAGLLLTVLSGVARSTYSELTGSLYLGYLSEEARTNRCIQNRDFTNAAWVMTTMTPAKDQIGIDGVAASASSLLATGANATAAQTITVAAVNRPFSVYVKWLVQTGTVALAQDGATFTVQTVPNDGSWHRVTLVASQLNPVLAIQLSASADKIAVDYAMLEDRSGVAASYPTTPIATTTVAVTRNGDALTFPATGNLVGTLGTAYCEYTLEATTSAALFYEMVGASGDALRVQSTGKLGYADGTNQAQGPAVAFPSTTPQKGASSWGGATGSVALNGAVTAGFAFDGDMGFGATVGLGCAAAGATQLNGTIKNVKLWTVRLSDAQMAAL